MVKKEIQSHVFESRPTEGRLMKTYISSDERLIAVAAGLTGWGLDVETEQFKTGDYVLDVFLRELDSLYTQHSLSLVEVFNGAGIEVKEEIVDSSVVALAVLIDANSSEAQVAHAGTCRAYLLSQRQLTKLTREHTVAQEMVRAGSISEAQVQNSQYKTLITRSVGGGSDQLSMRLNDEDRLILCTIGLWALFSDEELREAFCSQPDPFEFLERESIARKAERGWAAMSITFASDAHSDI